MKALSVKNQLATYFSAFYDCFCRLLKCFEGKKGGKDQESIQSSTTPDPRYHMGK